MSGASRLNDSDVRSNSGWHLSWDSILFILFWAAQFWSSESAGMILATEKNDVSLVVHLTRVFNYDPMPGVLLLVLMFYLGADLWLKGRLQFALKLAAIWIAIFVFVILPTLAATQYRHTSAPHLYIHDGAIQVEEAIKFLLNGKNPYAENYTMTPMAQWHFDEPGLTVNPSLFHLPYPPLTILASVPFYFLSQNTIGWYDQRFVYLAMFILGAIIATSVGGAPRQKLAALMIIALNPLFIPFFLQGRNDVVVTFWFLAAVLALQRRHLTAAGIAIACASASKQTAWFLVPFFIAYVIGAGSLGQLRNRVKVLFPGAAIFSLMCLPFLVWNANAFLNNVINYQSGIMSQDTLYPIKSLGLGSLLLGFHWVERNTATFPFSWFQIGFGGIALLVLLNRQRRKNTLTQLLVNYAVLLFVVSFFSRTFNDNHLGFALTWLILPSFITDSETDHLASRFVDQETGNR